MEKRWVVYPKSSNDLLEQLLANRAIRNKKSFLSPLLKNLTQLDKLFPEIDKAVSRIKKAILDKELVYIYGDYDVDGITGSAILWETIDFLGGKVMPYIPSRHSEGYGIHVEALEQIAKLGAKLIISVDCGITAVKQADIAQKLGIDLIITDHHQPQEELPKPFALIHTTALSGSGVAFRLAESLLMSFGQDREEQFYKNLELATLGTVADMVPLVEDSRVIVSNGLSLLTKTKRAGLRALYDEASIGKTIGTYEIGFIISPRLNATGRMESALDSLRLLLTKDRNRGIKLALSLNNLNKQRQEQTQKVFANAKEQIERSFSDKKFFIVSSKDYPEGIVGLVASRIVETFYKPTAIIGKGEKLYKGSARSISNFNVTQAINSQKGLLVSHGGHPMAAGFSIEETNIPQFRNNLEEIAESEISTEDLKPKLKIDTEVSLNNITSELISLIKQVEPFGIGNPEPVFLTRNLKISDLKRVGKKSEHLRLTLKDNDETSISGIGFNLGSKSLNKGDNVDIVYSVRENIWTSRKTIELRIKDIKPKSQV